MVTDWFMKSVDDTCRHYYRLTTTVYKVMTEHIVHDGITADGLIYPSVASNASGVNYAVKPEFIDAFIEFFGAILYSYKPLPDDGMELTLLKYAVPDHTLGDDAIIWKEFDTKLNPYILKRGEFPKDFPPLYS